MHLIFQCNQLFHLILQSTGLLKVDKNTYSKLLTDSIFKTYKMTEHNMYNYINKEDKVITKNYEVSERVDCLQNQMVSYF